MPVDKKRSDEMRSFDGSIGGFRKPLEADRNQDYAIVDYVNENGLVLRRASAAIAQLLFNSRDNKLSQYYDVRTVARWLASDQGIQLISVCHHLASYHLAKSLSEDVSRFRK